MTRASGRRALQRRLLSLAVAGAFAAWGGATQANPSGASVAVGSATITLNGNTLTIANTPGAVINWQQFSIRKDEITRFLQQNASSAVLNRVVGQDPSVILGQLLSNGRVFLINPSGIAIGRGAVIDVAGFAASTLNISDADWVSGRLRFEGTGLEGKVENLGTIKTAEGGHVYLIAPKVENKADGVIQSPQGEVIIAAGKTVELVNAGTPDIRVEYTAPDNAAVNAGQVVAEGGRIGIYGTLVKNSGRVSASRAVVGEGGKIVFKASKDVELDAGSKLEANGTRGGVIDVQADSGSIRAQGTIEASGSEAGGLIKLQAAQAIDVPAGAAVSAKGAGGRVELVAKNADAAPTEVRIGGKIEAGARVTVDAPTGRTEIASTAVVAAPEILVNSRIFAGEGSLDASGAQGGRIDIEADRVDWAGSFVAEGTAGDGGVVTVQAAESVVTSTESIVRVDGAQAGGEISIQAVQTEVLLSGTLSARGLTTGGEITVTAPKVETRGAVLDASGALGGGRVRVGGDYQGGGDVPQAKRTYVDLYTRIRADAEVEGDGGMVVVWSTDATWFAGEASVRGGAVAGDGGLVETSSKGKLLVTGSVDASAPNGGFGIFLLDPLNIVVASSGTALITDIDAFADNAGTTQTITPGALNAAAATVVLQATNDITISNAVNLTTANAGFIAQAGSDINVNATITTNGGHIQLEADSPHAGLAAYDGSGQVKINAEVNSCGGVAVASCGTGGNITLIGGGNSTPDGGFSLKADVVAGDGGINVAVSLGGNLNFFIGAGGNTQLSSKDTGALKTTGALVLGQALTAGPTGLSTSTLDGASQLTVYSITNETASPIQLSTESGSSFQLIAGDGGITLDRPLTSYQDMVIYTTGDLNVNQTLSTSNYDLTITADNVYLGTNGSIDVGEGTLSCLGSGCATLTGVYWTGTVSNYWSDGGNWSTGAAPTASQDVTVLDPEGDTVIIDGSAVAKSLTALSPVQVAATGTLDLKNSSTFSSDLALSGTLKISAAASDTNFITVSSAAGALTWDGGTLGISAGGSGTGAFFLSTDSAAALSNALTLDLEYQNAGTTTLSGATIGGTGSILNLSLNSMIVPAGTTTTVNVPVSSIGNATIDGTLNVGTLSLSGTGSFGGSGTLAVTTDFSGTSNLLGTGFTNLSLTKNGDFSIGALQASENLSLVTTNNGNLTITGGLVAGQATLVAGGSGDVTLAAGSSVTASGTGDAIVIVGDVFTNNVGNGVLTASSGRWLVYSTSPAGSTENGLTAAAGSARPRLYGRTYADDPPASVSEAGNHLIYSFQPTLTVAADDKVKVYGTDDPVQTYSISPAGYVSDDGVTDTAITAGIGGSFARASGEMVGAYAITQGSFGSDAGYGITFIGGRNLSITKAALTGTIANQTKTYGTDDPALPAVTLGGVVNASVTDWNGAVTALNDTGNVSVTLASLTRDAGETVGSYDITAGTFNALTGSAAGNYTASPGITGNTLTINPASLVVTADPQSKVYGSADPSLTYDATGFVSRVVSDWMGNATLINDTSAVLSGALARNPGETVNGGPYAITQGALGVGGNYVISFTGNSLTITPATLTYLATAASRERGDPNPAFTGTVTGFVAGDTLAGATTGALGFTTPALQSDPEGSYAINGGGLTANNGNYVFVQAPSNATALTITTPVNFSWTAAGSGDWGTGTNWNKGFAPVDGAIVTIPDLAGAQTITYASGATDLKSLTSYESLNLTGGTLNLGTTAGDVSTFQPGALLSLNGGTLGGSGTLNVSQANVVNGTLNYTGTVNFGALTQSAGTISVSGNVGVTNGFSQTGGSLSATNTLSLSGPGILVQGTTSAGALSVSTPGSLTVSAGATAASLISATNMDLQVGGNLEVLGGSGTDASATLANGPGTLSALVSGSVIITGGSGAGAYALLQGNPDVGSLADPMSIGGTLTITTGTGSGAFARLESTSAQTVYLFFPNLAPTDYGYAVDGVTGRIANGQTGIFAGGLPATLGSSATGSTGGIPGSAPAPDANLVTYYGIVAPVIDAVQQTQSEVFYRTDQLANLASIYDSVGVGTRGNGEDDEFDGGSAPACR